MKRTNQMTGSMGFRYVCYRLVERCWNVSFSKMSNRDRNEGTCRPKGSFNSITFQTQGMGGKAEIILNGGLNKITKDFLIVVVNLNSAPEAYIFTADEARDKMVEQGKPGSIRGFIEVRDYDTDEFRDRWDKLEV